MNIKGEKSSTRKGLLTFLLLAYLVLYFPLLSIYLNHVFHAVEGLSHESNYGVKNFDFLPFPSFFPFCPERLIRQESSGRKLKRGRKREEEEIHVKLKKKRRGGKGFHFSCMHANTDGEGMIDKVVIFLAMLYCTVCSSKPRIG